MLFNQSTPPLEGSWFLRGLWSWRKAAVHTDTFTRLLALGGAVAILWSGRSREAWVLSFGATLRLVLQVLPRRPYCVYALPSSIALAGLAGAAIAMLVEQTHSRRQSALLGFSLAALIPLQSLPASWEALSGPGELHDQVERSRYVLEHCAPGDVLFQGYPPFAIQVRDADFFGWMPLEMRLRAARVGLNPGPTPELLLREGRPAFVGLGAAFVPMAMERERLQRVLVEELGYRWNASWALYERGAPRPWALAAGSSVQEAAMEAR